MEHPTDPLIDGWIDQAMNGDPDAFRELLSHAAYFIDPERDRVMPDSLRYFLMHALGTASHAEHLGGIAKAFGLPVKKGRKRNQDGNGMFIACDVRNLIKAGCPKSTEPGGCYAEIGEKYHKSAKTIESTYREWLWLWGEGEHPESQSEQ